MEKHREHYVLFGNQLLRKRFVPLPCRICGDIPSSEEYALGTCCGADVQEVPETADKTISRHRTLQKILARAKRLSW